MAMEKNLKSAIGTRSQRFSIASDMVSPRLIWFSKITFSKIIFNKITSQTKNKNKNQRSQGAKRNDDLVIWTEKFRRNAMPMAPKLVDLLWKRVDEKHVAFIG